MSARASHRVLKLARIIADLAGAEQSTDSDAQLRAAGSLGDMPLVVLVSSWGTTCQSTFDARRTITLLGQTFKVGRRQRHRCSKAIVDTRHQRLTVYLAGKVLRRWTYKLGRTSRHETMRWLGGNFINDVRSVHRSWECAGVNHPHTLQNSFPISLLTMVG